MRRSRQSGFTFAEVAVVLAVLGILATMAVPRLVGDPIVTNERKAVEHLREIALAQLRFRAMSLVDRDNDRQYEFGTLPELAGGDELRGSEEALRRGLLARHYAHLDTAGRLELDGYLFALYLPDPAGAGRIATKENADILVDPSMAENSFVVIAWPVERERTGRRTYFIDQRAEVRLCSQGGYSGIGKVPEPGCALVGPFPERIHNRPLVTAGEVANDGHVWFGWR